MRFIRRWIRSITSSGLVVVKYATAEPDVQHPYGHAKFETLAAFAIAGFLFVTCYQISLSALSSSDQPARFSPGDYDPDHRRNDRDHRDQHRRDGL